MGRAGTCSKWDQSATHDDPVNTGVEKPELPPIATHASDGEHTTCSVATSWFPFASRQPKDWIDHADPPSIDESTTGADAVSPIAKQAVGDGQVAWPTTSRPDGIVADPQVEPPSVVCSTSPSCA